MLYWTLQQNPQHLQKNQDWAVFFSLDQLTKETRETAPEEKFANINKDKGSLEHEMTGVDDMEGCSDPVWNTFTSRE